MTMKEEVRKAKIHDIAVEIMKDAEMNNEPISLEDAMEMAEWEWKEKANRRYEKSDAPRKKSSRERKIDETKKRFINGFRIYLEGSGCKVDPLKNETDLHFTFEDEKYSVKLTKHRAPKQGAPNFDRVEKLHKYTPKSLCNLPIVFSILICYTIIVKGRQLEPKRLMAYQKK